MPRSEYIPLAILSIMNVGATYIPLDPELPAGRLNYIIDHSAPDLILSTSFRKPEKHLNRPLIEIDTVLPEYSEGTGRVPVPYEKQDTVYLIYTSGSTGKPKGVEVLYESVVNFFCSVKETPGIGSDDLLLAISTISFDIAFTEVVVPLLAGASICVATDEEQKSGEELKRLTELHQVTLLQGTPTTFKLLLRAGWSKGTPLKKVISTGEALPQEVAAGILATGVELWDMYGPTEATIEATYSRITNAEDIPIGTPLWNTRLYVLDEAFRQVPVGALGELYIAGICLAKGYLDQPELTEEKFIRITGQKLPEERIYKTGDVVRFSTDGVLYYHGRNDHQVKVRGYRIELEEIEHVLRSLPGVSDCCVMAESSSAGNAVLKACLIPAPGSSLNNLEEIQSHLKKHLPGYMIPAFFYKRKSLPLLPNGKIDRKILFSDGEYITAPVEKAPLANEMEQQVAGIWAEVLGKSASGPERNFFDEGGSSLLIPELQSRFALNFQGVKIRLVDFFKYTTIRSQAVWIQKESKASGKVLQQPVGDLLSSAAPEAITILDGPTRKELRINYRTLVP